MHIDLGEVAVIVNCGSRFSMVCAKKTEIRRRNKNMFLCVLYELDTYLSCMMLLIVLHHWCCSIHFLCMLSLLGERLISCRLFSL